MGKVRRLRQKYHASLSSNKNDDDKNNDDGDAITTLPREIPKLVPTFTGAPTAGSVGNSGNIFAGLEIKLDDVVRPPTTNVTTHKTDEVDVMSTVSESRRNRTGSKRERMKKRHDEFMQKIDAIRVGKQAEKDRRKREKTAIVGDVHPMRNALPSLEELMTSSRAKTDNQKLKKSKGNLKQEDVQKDFLSDVQMFVAVTQDPVFNKDPFAALRQATENRLKYEDS
ncbi:hypothetical protein Pmani_030564 [Petrolisthes manimaculis]|uniref:Ribosome biogenesis protein SLX9 n=1 Tax=Petrolisthes manimaculis TaxID=1843537 RepID=A0AAE1NX23_9EUCA|nr:hypothetical protein Pmani_030564 [Petrolisthes manimaculis]